MESATHETRTYDAPMPFDPVGLSEIAVLLGKAHETLKQWSSRGVLPEPAARIGGVPIWSKREIEKWAKKTGRLPADD